MREMSHEEWVAFVNTATRTGKLAVRRANGAPHVTPVWFLVTDDGGHVVFNTGVDSVKGKALRRDPRFALCVDTQEPPYDYVLIEAEAELSEDVAAMLPVTTRIGGRYLGAERAEEFGRRNAVAGEYLVRGRITRVTAFADLTF